MKSREEMMDIVLASPGLLQRIARSAGAASGDGQASRERAREYFLEIASDYNERWLNLWKRTLSFLWRAIYDDFVIDQEGMAKLREIAHRMPCVILPSHRSHVDYLILSYIFYLQKIPLPHVAAGDNMNFWPLGPIFRQSGAFFLRRRFQGDNLYADVFLAYVETLLSEGVPIEFFLEGGRSRTGKMVQPKYGMLAMILRAYQHRVSEDIALLPVYLGYDRIIEEDSYLAELSGASKRSESVLDVIKHAKIMRHRYGNIYLNFGEPISLKSYFAGHTKKFAELTTAEQQALYRDVGSLVVSGINRVSVTTPLALVAAALLCHGRRETTEALLVEIFGAFTDYLGYQKTKLAPSLAFRDQARTAAVQIFLKRGCLDYKKNKGGNNRAEGSYLLADAERLRLEYYKNNIIHHFVPLSFLSAAILSGPETLIDWRLVREEYIFLKGLFAQEFLRGKDHDVEIASAQAYLRQRGVLKTVNERGEEVLPEGRESLLPFAGLVQSYLESYLTVFRACAQLDEEPEKEKDQLDYIRGWAAKMNTRGGIRRAESISGAYYANALKFLRGEAVMGPVIDKNRLASLQSHLARFL